MTTAAVENRKIQALVEAIDRLERRHLDDMPEAELGGAGGRTVMPEMFRVCSVPKWREDDSESDEVRIVMDDVLAGLYGLNMPFLFCLLADGSQVGVYVGSRRSGQAAPTDPASCLAASLRSAYPGLELAPLAGTAAAARVAAQLDRAAALGILTGTPTRKPGTVGLPIEQLERLARGLRNCEWGYAVVAEPIPMRQVLEAMDYLFEELRVWYSEVKVSEQVRTGVNEQTSVERLDRLAQYYTELLELGVSKLKLAKAAGMWWTSVYLFAPERATYDRLKGLLSAIFSGEESAPEPIRILDCADVDAGARFLRTLQPLSAVSRTLPDDVPAAFGAYQFMTALGTLDLATLCYLPREEMPGYNVVDFARFGVCVPEPEDQDAQLTVGCIVDRGQESDVVYALPTPEITRHGLIVGVTGSGKTNTCMVLLEQLWAQGVPFLAIEPAKSEYRNLLRTGRFQDVLQVYTLGDETQSPFRLNPFEVLPGTNLQTHVDNLKAVFNASISMWPPLPTVLERCIHEVYLDKGWDLALNRNRWLEEGCECPAELFPTLSDLYDKVDEVVEALGYEQKVTMDVRAALKTRINGLRVGGKGLMLDTRVSVPIGPFLEGPVLVELKAMGDDDEKAFVMGLLLMRIYEYREALAVQGGPARLPHVTLIEEAHRLLTNVPTVSTGPEASNVRGKAVETFCNVLSEMRAFGEGVLIAEQIPVKLAPDAIKNTNLKIVHRLVAADDREVAGGTMNLSEEQTDTLALLRKGQAAVYAEGLDEAVLVKVPLVKDAMCEKVVARVSAREEGPSASVLASGAMAGCGHCRYACQYRSVVRDLLTRFDLAQAIPRLTLSAVNSPASTAAAFAGFLRELWGRVQPGAPQGGQELAAGWCLVTHLTEEFFWRKVRQCGLAYDRMTRVRDAFLNGVASCRDASTEARNGATAQAELGAFAREYREVLRSDDGPFDACALCQDKCLYRFEAAAVAKGKQGRRIVTALALRNDTRRKTVEACWTAAAALAPYADADRLRWIAFCTFLHVLDDRGYLNLPLMAREFLVEADRMALATRR